MIPRLQQFLASGCGLILALVGQLAAEPIPLTSAQATFHSRSAAELARVIDGITIGPEGWSVAPHLDRPQAVCFRCTRLVEVPELEISLFFLSGRPNNSIAEFSLSYTTDAEPTLGSQWKPLTIRRFAAEVATLQRTHEGHLRADMLPDEMTGKIPDDTYRIVVQSPESRITGFRLDVFPVRANPYSDPWMSWGSPHDFVLTEFRVEEHPRESTNIALYRPVQASHSLFDKMQASALVDGLPSTIAHPASEIPTPNFFYEVDFGRVANFDHLALRNRGDDYIDRFSRIQLKLYDEPPSTGASPTWQGMIRADGSYPAAGTADIVRADQGRGVYRGRYLRVSSESKIPHSPQLAEIEAYETRTPVVSEVFADNRMLPLGANLDLPAGAKRLALHLRIPQLGLPPGVAFRWRMRGYLNEWQSTRQMTIDMPCPPPGKTAIFEAQALHSNHQWDASILRLPITSRQHLWEHLGFQLALVLITVAISMWLARFSTRRRAARQLAEMKARAALAEERTRIARDLHDDLGANLARIGFLTELVERALPEPDKARNQLEKIYLTTRDLTRQLDSVVWAVDPANDHLEGLVRYLHGLASEYLELVGIRCNFTNTERMPFIQVSSTFRHQLLMMVKEALHNIAAHSGATVVSFDFVVDGGYLLLEICDNGCGLPTSDALTPGNGLENMQKRALDLGGICDFFAPEVGTGMGVRFTLPLPAHAKP